MVENYSDRVVPVDDTTLELLHGLTGYRELSSKDIHFTNVNYIFIKTTRGLQLLLKNSSSYASQVSQSPELIMKETPC